MKVYRNWIYKIIFWVFCQIAVYLAFILSGDILKIWSDGVEWDIRLEEKPTD